MGSAVNQKDLKIESQKMDGSELPLKATTKTSSKRYVSKKLLILNVYSKAVLSWLQ